jgi:mannosyltransferase
VLALACCLRFARIDHDPFWLDEVFSHDLSSGSAGQVLHAVAHDPHPPLYYLGLKGWRAVAGDSVAAMRGFSAAASLLGVMLVILFARDLGGRWSVGLAAGLLAAVNPVDIYFGQQARMYAQAAALGTLSSWLLLRWMRAEAEPGRRRWCWAVGYWLAAVLMLHTLYLGLTILVAQGLFALVIFARRRAWRAVGGYVLCALGSAAAFLPWLATLRSSHGALYSADSVGWIPRPTARDALALVARDPLFGHAALSPQGWQLATALCCLLLLAIAWGVGLTLTRPDGRDTQGVERTGIVFAGWLLAGPVVLALGVSWVYHPVLYPPRFCVLVVPPFLALAAVAVERLRPARVGLPLLLALVAAMAGASISHLRSVDTWGLGGFASLWHEQGPPDDVLFYPRWNRRVAGFYLGQPVLNVPTRQQLEGELRHGKARRIWVVRRIGNTMAGEPETQRTLLDWVLTLGPERRLPQVDDVEVTEVEAQPLPRGPGGPVQAAPRRAAGR